MIDLRIKELPSQIECDGFFYEIDTDFRTWIHFEYLMREEKTFWDGIFVNKKPDSFDWVESALEFLKSENVTPNYKHKILEKSLDLVLDGDYIVAAFQQAYGIDLTTCDMHWHRFHALLIGLPEDTLLSKAMGYRTYSKSREDHHKIMMQNKAAWTFPAKDLEDRKEELLEWANSVFE